MNSGWIKLWRKSLDAGWLQNHKLWTFWCWCLMKASHKEHDQIIGYQKIHLMPGEFVFGLKVASKELKMSIQSIRTCVKFLKTSENLTVKPTNKFSTISIINWNTYQDKEIETNSQTNKRLTNKQQTTNNKQECNKNVKNVKIYIPDNFSISERVKVWAYKNNFQNLEQHLEHFKLSCTAKGYKYVDWDSAFMRAIKDNWAKINIPSKNKLDSILDRT